jgi:hypothetical protein
MSHIEDYSIYRYRLAVQKQLTYHLVPCTLFKGTSAQNRKGQLTTSHIHAPSGTTISSAEAACQPEHVACSFQLQPSKLRFTMPIFSKPREPREPRELEESHRWSSAAQRVGRYVASPGAASFPAPRPGQASRR